MKPIVRLSFRKKTRVKFSFKFRDLLDLCRELQIFFPDTTVEHLGVSGGGISLGDSYSRRASWGSFSVGSSKNLRLSLRTFPFLSEDREVDMDTILYHSGDQCGDYAVVLKAENGRAFTNDEVENIIDVFLRFVYKHQEEPSFHFRAERWGKDLSKRELLSSCEGLRIPAAKKKKAELLELLRDRWTWAFRGEPETPNPAYIFG
tara:strand:+ start:258 stop:869 length:612 start_codon:yes stop_codon:yes gene_type:complete